jgi:hypothetical protein
MQKQNNSSLQVISFQITPASEKTTTERCTTTTSARPYYTTYCCSKTLDEMRRGHVRVTSEQKIKAFTQSLDGMHGRRRQLLDTQFLDSIPSFDPIHRDSSIPFVSGT